ncbi:unnamed protein product [Microthlaspi erraticum]|uniref:Pentacotripeptide-repeat region of PRORP domain-containing protein n=3 Tax=Microthlaspi erraticum TaxID=1685480 RepID=A0A6D2ILY3_9BRAS|nr:unnamed protein product [Microthlaspi erraticum]
MWNKTFFEHLSPVAVTSTRPGASSIGLGVMEHDDHRNAEIWKWQDSSSKLLRLEAWTAMITGYMKANKVALAEAEFKDMTVKKNLVTWNAMISGYVENSRPEDGLKLFRAMMEEGVRPNASGLSSELSALQLGSQIHQIAMEKKDVVAWNAIMSGYAQHGKAEKALSLFCEMRDNRTKPDWITFVAVLLACNHAGLEYFDSMVRDYRVEPRPDHYTCMVDLLGRAGKLAEALKLIRSMPFRPQAAACGTRM